MPEPWQYNKCCMCNRQLYKTTMHRVEDTFICDACIELHNGPGKFGVYQDEKELLGTALILYYWSSDGSEDEYMSHDGWGYCGRFGKYLMYEDSSGFVTFDEFPDIVASSREFQRLYEDGWGANDYDAFIGCHNGRWIVQFEGKQLDVWGRGNTGHPRVLDEGIDEKRCIARVRLEAMKTGYYPPLWSISDHGNLSLLTY